MSRARLCLTAGGISTPYCSLYRCVAAPAPVPARPGGAILPGRTGAPRPLDGGFCAAAPLPPLPGRPPLTAPPPLPTPELQLMSYPSKTFEVMMDNLSIMGDKEMFPWGATALGREYAVIKYGVGAAGTDMGGFQGRAMEQYGPDGLLQFMHANIPEWTCDSAPRLPLAENQRFPLLLLPEGRVALREYLSRPEWAAAGGLKGPALETLLWALVKGLCSAMD